MSSLLGVGLEEDEDYSELSGKRRGSKNKSPQGSPSTPKSNVSVKERIINCFSYFDNMDLLTRPRAKQGDQELEVFNAITQAVEKI